MHRLGIALVGAGFMGTRHVHGYAALQAAGVARSEVVAILDLNQEVAERAADEAQQLLGRRPLVYTELDALLGDPAVEAVDIVTDPRTHAPIAIAAMEAGRHVLCEKPLALTIRGARAMVDAARRTGVVLATGENYRRGGANRLARAVLDAGLLGTVHLMREVRIGGDSAVIISKWRHMKASGAIGLDMAIHYADIVEYFLGPVETVWGRGIIAEPLRFPADGGDAIVPDGEDSIIASLRTRSNVDVQLAYLPSGPGTRFSERTVHGTDGSMTVPPDRTDGEVVVTLGDRVLRGPDLVEAVGVHLSLSKATVAVLGADGTGGKGALWSVVDSGYLAVEIDDFADAVQSARPPEVDGVGGMRALAVVLAVLESGTSGRAVTVDEVLDGSVHAYQDSIDATLAVSSR
ncbi:Gfo/Idh/MocA family oxidoreductase [Microbacterium sp. STN6]|uniref:Gfo/Idh/MocA family protein n=1 Tax=Microbacterium sp. STN6 TaxID=2995588 RepID=UPI002260C855|nr:Gfo/Idh/MocA family oxidoreductase [Microbacterium sp. STN6]MCX7522531.1 Gfo/Idh/MocA family oxidoreductase [Microbacterium sp. STN6]